MAKKMPLSQTFIPVPPAPNAKAYLTEEDKEREYEKHLGVEAAERQRRLFVEAHQCTCGVDAEAGKPMAIRYHKPGCHKIPLKLRSVA